MLFLEGVSAGGLIHGEFIGKLIGISSLVSIFGGLSAGGLSTAGGTIMDFYGISCVCRSEIPKNYHTSFEIHTVGRRTKIDPIGSLWGTHLMLDLHTVGARRTSMHSI